MPIPLTFSAPGESFAVSDADALRYAGWLTHYSDAAMRSRYAYDSHDLAAGIRIVERRREIYEEDQGFTIPQCIFATSFVDERWQYETGGKGKRFVAITANHLFHYDTKYANSDLSELATDPTFDMVCSRSEDIFRRGTLYLNAWAAYAGQEIPETNDGILIDPRSPIFTEETAPDPSLVGTYDPATVLRLTDGPPKDIQRVGALVWRLMPKKDEDVVPNKHFAVLYGVKVTYQLAAGSI